MMITLFGVPGNIVAFVWQLTRTNLSYCNGHTHLCFYRVQCHHLIYTTKDMAHDQIPIVSSIHELI